MNSLLYPQVFKQLNINEIRPEGWLLNQLKIQAAGLSGNLDKFWPDIKDSAWIGGATDCGERMPYWLDGFIPLAWLLDDKDMKARATCYIDNLISHNSPDGWLCPDKYDTWSLFLMLKVLVVYHDATGDWRIQDVIRNALEALDRQLDTNTLCSWGQTRWYECLIPICWLYERTGEEWLVFLAFKLHSQGFDWQSFFKNWPYKKPGEKRRWSYMSHVVNNAMMLKSGGLLWRFTGDRAHLDAAEEIVKLLDEYHGMVTGVFSGDECLIGKSPVQGTELCAVGEYMYSLEHLAAITGRPHWGDRLEKIAYNALPATFSPDMWTHQYDQQVNQVECSFKKEPFYCTNKGDANLFGLEPEFGCCTANLSQPWPKLALSTFMRSEDGLAAVVYAPCTVSTMIGAANVVVTLETGYPFRDTLKFTIETDQEAEFVIWLRIPRWTSKAEIVIENETFSAAGGDFHSLKRKWSGRTIFTLRLPMEPCIESRPNGLAAITRGPLVYSLPIGENWIRINEEVPGREYPHCDYEIYPTTPWNYGLCLDRESICGSLKFDEHPIGDCPFSPAGAPVSVNVKGRKVDWSKENGSATPAPEMKWVSEEVEKLTLIPYGCTNLRMTEMPIV